MSDDGHNQLSTLVGSRASGARRQPADQREELVNFGQAPWILPGTLSLHVRLRAIAGVLLVHGSGPQDWDETIGVVKPFRDLARGLASRGMAVLRYQKRTRQYPALCGNLRDFTIRDETIEDAVRAVEFMRRDRRIGDRIVILGHSLGGMLAPTIAAEAGGVAGVIMMAAPARPIPHLILEQIRHLAAVSPFITRSVIGLVQRQVNAALDRSSEPGVAAGRQLLGLPLSYWYDLGEYAPLAAARAADVPMLVLHAGRDYQVTSSDLAAWRSVLDRRPNATIKIYPRLNHCFIEVSRYKDRSDYSTPGRVAPRVIGDISDWINRLGSGSLA